MEFKLENLSISPTILANNKYKRFIDSTRRNNGGYIESWQKTVYNDYGKAYFINFEFNDMSHIYSLHNINSNPYSWNADMQLNTIDEMTINIQVLGANHNLKYVEDFCEKMFKQMQFRNYDYYSSEDEYEHKKNLEVINNVTELEKELEKENTNKHYKKIKV